MTDDLGVTLYSSYNIELLIGCVKCQSAFWDPNDEEYKNERKNGKPYVEFTMQILAFETYTKIVFKLSLSTFISSNNVRNSPPCSFTQFIGCTDRRLLLRGSFTVN